MKSFLGILCQSCNVYFRIYPNAMGVAYEGRCPRCRRLARALIDPKRGVKKRFILFR